MKKTDTRKEIQVIIDRIPKKNLLKVKRILEDYLAAEVGDEDSPVLIEALEDESGLKPEFIEELREAEEAVRTGNTVTLEEYLKESAEWK